MGGQKPEGLKALKTSVLNSSVRVLGVLKHWCQIRQRGGITAVCSNEDVK